MAKMELNEEKHDKLTLCASFSYHVILCWAVFAENAYISVRWKTASNNITELRSD